MRPYLFYGGVLIFSTGLVVGQVIPQKFPQYDLSVQSESTFYKPVSFIVNYSTYLIFLGLILFLTGLFI